MPFVLDCPVVTTPQPLRIDERNHVEKLLTKDVDLVFLSSATSRFSQPELGC